LLSGFAQTRFEPANFEAGEGIRTLDPNLGKVVLYPDGFDFLIFE